MRAPTYSMPINKVLVAMLMLGTIFAVTFYLVWMRSWGPRHGQVNHDLGTYAWKKDLPLPRTEAGGTSLQGKFYVVGGIDSLAQTFSDLQVYDPALDSWNRLADFPRPINHPGVVADDHFLYSVGGFGPLGIRVRGFMFARWDPYDQLERFDPAANRWTSLARMPSPRGAGGVTLGGGKIWYVGGIDPERNLSKQLFAYEIATNTWEEMPPMKYARDHMRLEYYEGAIYAISGRRDDMRFNLGHVEKFDIATRTWTKLPPIPTPRGGFGSAVLDGKIYTFGGESVWTCFDTVEALNLSTETWEAFPALPEARHGIIAGTIGNSIHLISGGRHPRVSISGLHRTFSPAKREQ